MKPCLRHFSQSEEKSEVRKKNDETTLKGGSILYLSDKSWGKGKVRDRKWGERFLHNVLRGKKRDEEGGKRVKRRRNKGKSGSWHQQPWQRQQRQQQGRLRGRVTCAAAQAHCPEGSLPKKGSVLGECSAVTIVELSSFHQGARGFPFALGPPLLTHGPRAVV